MAMQIVPQGTLNRLQGSIVCTSEPQLNVTSPYLGTEGIRLSFDSNATDLLPTMTGMVTSPAPYQQCTLTMALVKSTQLAAIYQEAFSSDTYIGDMTIYPDIPAGGPGLIPFTLYNMALETVREMSFAGLEPVIVVTARGYRLVNQDLF